MERDQTQRAEAAPGSVTASGTLSERRYVTEKPESVGLLDTFDRKLDRLAAQLEALEGLLAPVRDRHLLREMVEEVADRPTGSELRGRLDRLDNLLNRLSSVMDEVDL